MARNAHLDVAKGILITLVVVGHALESGAGAGQLGGWESSPQEYLLAALYIFHMPAFAFTVGLTAKANRLAERIVLPLTLFVIFQVLYAGPFILTGGQSWWAPGYALWFLLAMAWWHVYLPLVARFPMPAFVLAIALAVLAGAVPVDASLAAWVRTLTTLPFFVAGYMLTMRRIPAAGSGGAALLSAGGLILVAVAAAILIPSIWVRGASTFATADASFGEGVLWRAVTLALSAVAVWLFLRAISFVRSGWFERAGKITLAIYVLHIPVMIAFAIVVTRLGGFNPWLETVLGLALGLAAAHLLALPIFARVSDFLRVVGLAPLTIWRLATKSRTA